MPLDTATLIDVREGPRPASPQPVWALPSLPLLPRHLEEGKERCPCWEGSPKGPCGCRLSTEKSDAVRKSWKQAVETGWDVEGQLNPRFWDSLGATPWVPPCMGREGVKRQEGGLPSALTPLQP